MSNSNLGDKAAKAMRILEAPPNGIIMSADDSNLHFPNPEIARLNGELIAAGLVAARLFKELEASVQKEQALNQRLGTVRNQNQNPRTLFLAVSDLLYKRAKVFTELSMNTIAASELCSKSADTLGKQISQLDESWGAV